MIVRKLEIDDIDECVNLFIKVFSQKPWEDEWASFEYAKSYLLDFVNTPGFIGLVATKDSKIIGSSFGHIQKWWSGTEFFISEFFIDTNIQGQGVGKTILNYLQNKLSKMNINCITLLTSRDVDAYKFYEKCGFKTAEKTVLMFNNYK
ncbi:MAG: GNAT family N-acetyltransferase [Candidatus Delongbacteria bacterium]|nr:GNAT family N-acetyltransferase [Candidatus Delongbacteria bacterium]